MANYGRNEKLYEINIYFERNFQPTIKYMRAVFSITNLLT